MTPLFSCFREKIIPVRLILAYFKKKDKGVLYNHVINR